MHTHIHTQKSKSNAAIKKIIFFIGRISESRAHKKIHRFIYNIPYLQIQSSLGWIGFIGLGSINKQTHKSNIKYKLERRRRTRMSGKYFFVSNCFRQNNTNSTWTGQDRTQEEKAQFIIKYILLNQNTSKNTNTQ